MKIAYIFATRLWEHSTCRLFNMSFKHTYNFTSPNLVSYTSTIFFFILKNNSQKISGVRTVLIFKVHLSLWTEIRAQKRVIHDVCAHCSMTDGLQAKKDILLFSSRKSAAKRTFYSARLGLYFEKGSIHFASIMDTNTV